MGVETEVSTEGSWAPCMGFPFLVFLGFVLVGGMFTSD